MRTFTSVIFSWLLLSAVIAIPAMADEVGRYIITTGETTDIGRVVILFDTETGRTRRLEKVEAPLEVQDISGVRIIDTRWTPLRFQSKPGKVDSDDPLIPPR